MILRKTVQIVSEEAFRWPDLSYQQIPLWFQQPLSLRVTWKWLVQEVEVVSTYGQFPFSPCQGWDEHCLSHPLPSSCTRAGWQMRWCKVGAEALGFGLRNVSGLDKSPTSSLCSDFPFAACPSQSKFFNPQFISSRCSFCYSRNAYKGDKKLKNQTPGIVLTRMFVPALNVTPSQGTVRGPSSSSPPAPGYLGQQGKEERFLWV